jgi:hypothetical protein
MTKNLFLVLTVFIISTVSSIFFYNNSFADTYEGRCTGGSSCSACKNCSKCMHCNSGGSCGVCSRGNSTRNSSSNSSTQSKSGSSTKTTQTGTKTTSQGKSVTSKEYFVDPLTISVRKTPGPTGEIICTLKEFDSVTLLKMYDTIWAQIEAICGGIKVIGFTLKSNLIKIEN